MNIGPPTPVQICQVEEEFIPLLELYRQRAPKRVLEIGTASGGTMYHWLRNATPDAVIVTVDLPEPEYPSSLALFAGWTPEGVECIPVIGDSHDPQTQAAISIHAPFDWLFIDGSHRYEDVLQDWNYYAPMCREGAVVVFHDIALTRQYENGDEAGVGRVWRQIQAEGLLTQEIRAKPLLNEYGLGLVFLP